MKKKIFTIIVSVFFIGVGAFANISSNKTAKLEPTHVDISKPHKKVIVQWEDRSSVKYQLEASYDLKTWFLYTDPRGNINHVTLNDTKTNNWMFFRVIEKSPKSV